MKNINCYIHIPFCTSKCKYCRFASFSGINQLKVNNYVNFLCNEILETKEKYVLDTIYFGGGTPSTLSLNQFDKIFSTLKDKFIFSEEIEINIESTPEMITEENLIGWEKLGINRISIGIQSLNKNTLYEIARTEKGDIILAFDTLKNFFNNKDKNISISLDFIIGLPFVKKGELKKDLEYILYNYDFIKHFSVYMLEEYYEIPEEKFSEFENITYPNSWKNNSLSEDDFLEEYLEIKRFLENNGFFRYEISNFSNKGFECKHNIGYWNHKESLAFGLGAHGFIENIRFANSESFLDYYSRKNIFKDNVGEKDIFLEKIMFGLRTSGIEKKYLEKLNKERIKYFLENGYLGENNNKIFLKDKSTLFLDYIISEII